MNSQLKNYANNYRELLLNIVHSTLQSFTKTEFLTNLVEQIGIKSGAGRVYIIEPDKKDPDTWNNTFEWCAEGVDPTIDTLQGFTKEITDNLYFFQQVFANQAFVYDRVSDIPERETRHLLARQGILSIFVLPILSQNKVSALLGFDITDTHVEWTAEIKDIMFAISGLITSALDHFATKQIVLDELQKSRTILDILPDLIYITDVETHEVLFRNNALRTQFKDHDLNLPCYKLFQGLNSPCGFCTNDQLKHGGPPVTWKHHNTLVDAHFQVTDTIIHWGKNKNARLSVAHNITDVLESQKREILALEASEIKNRFLGTVSHELHTPLNGLTHLIELAKSADIDTVAMDHLEKATTVCQELNVLLTNIIDYVSLDNQTVALKILPFNPTDLFHTIKDVIADKIKQKNLQLNINLDENLPKAILSDKSKIIQMLVNLLDNAIKFTPHGSITITCNILKKYNHNIILRIEVADTGVGITKKYLQELYQVFSKADESLTREKSGIGIGLPIVYKITKEMHGRLSVVSKEDEGSVFTLDLPCKLPRKDADKNIRLNKLLNGMTALIVDDNHINILILQAILRKYGCTVAIAHNGKDAVDMVRNNSHYNFILMDIQMPVMDGWLATKYIRNDYTAEQLPIIACTAQTQRQDEERCVAVGMQALVPKPINADLLLKYIRQFLRV